MATQSNDVIKQLFQRFFRDELPGLSPEERAAFEAQFEMPMKRWPICDDGRGTSMTHYALDGLKRWDELDAIVLEEIEALRRTPHETIARDETQGDETPDSAEEDAPVADDEAFIDRTVEFLRGRRDAEALLAAIAEALAEGGSDEPEGVAAGTGTAKDGTGP
jgi:hypothetical protein